MTTCASFTPRTIVPAVLFALSVVLAESSYAEDLRVFGPRQYDVKARYGADNTYREKLQTTQGAYLLSVQNGTQPSSRPEIVDLSVNGTALIHAEQFSYPFLACFLTLGKENGIELNLRDQKPSGLNRPVLPPRSLSLAVEHASLAFPEGVYGIRSWESLDEFIGTVRAIQSSESRDLATRASDLRQPADARVKALRSLGARMDRSAREYLLARYQDVWAVPVVRAEAAVALGMLKDVQSVPVLLDGITNPNDTVRQGAARALSLYPEETVRPELALRLGRLDPLMRTAVVRSIADSGWRPIGTIGELAGSADQHVAAVAIELLGHMRDPRATDLLLKHLNAPDERDLTVTIQALGESRDARAVEPLLALARDPVRRKEREAALGTALAALGDQRAESVIRELAETVVNTPEYLTLRSAYRTLTGKELVQKKK